MSTMTIMRGLPGSGKTWLAEQLAHAHVAVIASADDHFGLGGDYQFDATQLHQAHEWCRSVAKSAIANGRNIIVDNTNTQAWEMRPYVEMATSARVQVVFVESNAPWAKDPEECARRNTHGVPLAVIAKMAERWEPNVTVEQCLTAERPMRRTS